jgi:hypothetical protein
MPSSLLITEYPQRINYPELQSVRRLTGNIRCYYRPLLIDAIKIEEEKSCGSGLKPGPGKTALYTVR